MKDSIRLFNFLFVLQIHWFSIFNSFMMVIFLVGLVSMILMRTLRKDYARYSKEDDIDDMEKDLGDEYGWKQVSTTFHIAKFIGTVFKIMYEHSIFENIINLLIGAWRCISSGIQLPDILCSSWNRLPNCFCCLYCHLFRNHWRSLHRVSQNKIFKCSISTKYIIQIYYTKSDDKFQP